MDRKSKIYVFVACGIMLLFVVFFLMKDTLGNQRTITLPPEETDEGPQTGETGSQLNDSVSLVQISPETVQAVIEKTLERPAAYQARLRVTTYWSGGSGGTETLVYASGGLLRADTTEADGTVRHLLTDGARTALWYDEETSYYLTDGQALTADDELHVPSYEDVLRLDREQILEAAYVTYGQTPCIYVKTEEEGYQRVFYVSVESGLLVGAEIYRGEQLTYSAVYSEYAALTPDDALFLLPDGGSLR